MTNFQIKGFQNKTIEELQRERNIPLQLLVKMYIIENMHNPNSAEQFLKELEQTKDVHLKRKIEKVLFSFNKYHKYNNYFKAMNRAVKYGYRE